MMIQKLAMILLASGAAAYSTPVVKDYPCGGGYCTGDGTCCTGHAAPCCPYVSGTCCASTDSCCPSGTNCYFDPSTGIESCAAGAALMDKSFLLAMTAVTEKAPLAMPKKSVVKPVVKDYPCGGGYCTGDGTCCTGHAAPCCPYVTGTCCASTDSCCPSGTNCYFDPSTGIESCAAGAALMDKSFLLAMTAVTEKP